MTSRRCSRLGGLGAVSQLEAYIALTCDAAHSSEGACLHTVDLRSIYRSTALLRASSQLPS